MEHIFRLLYIADDSCSSRKLLTQKRVSGSELTICDLVDESLHVKIELKNTTECDRSYNYLKASQTFRCQRLQNVMEVYWLSSTCAAGSREETKLFSGMHVLEHT